MFTRLKKKSNNYYNLFLHIFERSVWHYINISYNKLFWLIWRKISSSPSDCTAIAERKPRPEPLQDTLTGVGVATPADQSREHNSKRAHKTPAHPVMLRDWSALRTCPQNMHTNTAESTQSTRNHPHCSAIPSRSAETRHPVDSVVEHRPPSAPVPPALRPACCYATRLSSARTLRNIDRFVQSCRGPCCWLAMHLYEKSVLVHSIFTHKAK